MVRNSALVFHDASMGNPFLMSLLYLVYRNRCLHSLGDMPSFLFIGDSRLRQIAFRMGMDFYGGPKKMAFRGSDTFYIQCRETGKSYIHFHRISQDSNMNAKFLNTTLVNEMIFTVGGNESGDQPKPVLVVGISPHVLGGDTLKTIRDMWKDKVKYGEFMFYQIY